MIIIKIIKIIIIMIIIIIDKAAGQARGVRGRGVRAARPGRAHLLLRAQGHDALDGIAQFRSDIHKKRESEHVLFPQDMLAFVCAALPHSYTYALSFSLPPSLPPSLSLSLTLSRQDMLASVCAAKGLDFEAWLERLKAGNKWHVEVY
jgi:hypothetical protein